MKRTQTSSYLSSKQIRFFIAATILVFFTFTLTAQFFNATLAVDGSFDSGPLISKDAHTDDVGRLLDADTSLYALIVSLLLTISLLSSSFLAARNIFAASLFICISASPRAPPVALA